MLMRFTPVLVFVFFTLFTVDIPCVLFVFIYGYWFKIGGEISGATCSLMRAVVIQHEMSDRIVD